MNVLKEIRSQLHSDDLEFHLDTTKTKRFQMSTFEQFRMMAESGMQEPKHFLFFDAGRDAILNYWTSEEKQGIQHFFNIPESAPENIVEDFVSLVHTVKETIWQVVADKNPHCQQVTTDSVKHLLRLENARNKPLYEMKTVIDSEFPQVPFFDRPRHERSTFHSESLKQFHSELNFFLTVLKISKEKSFVVVYAGTPGKHIQILPKLFETFEFVVFDEFTDDTMEKVLSKYGSQRLLFVSEVKTAKGDTSFSAEMKLQRYWVETLQPFASLLKFRPSWKKERELYLNGDICVQAFPSATSAETSLINLRDKHGFELKEYDNKAYERNCCFHNSVQRTCVYDFDKPIVTFLDGFDRCFDCTYFINTILEYYSVVHDSVAPNDEVVSFLDALFESLGTPKTLVVQK
jgi:hypothetical protein